MSKTSLLLSSAFVLVAIAITAAASSGCGSEDPAEGVVVNNLAANVPVTIEKVWFRTTLFTKPIAIGESSETLRVGTGTERAYALVRIGEDDPDAGASARRFVAQTKEPISSEVAKKVTIDFSAASARSLCFGDPRLTRDEWDFITSRIFPGDAVVDFEDPGACLVDPPAPAPSPDGGVSDASDDGG